MKVLSSIFYAVIGLIIGTIVLTVTLTIVAPLMGLIGVWEYFQRKAEG